jgi:hypothetical protein
MNRTKIEWTDFTWTLHEKLLCHKAGHEPKYTPILSLNSLFRILADIDKLGR